MEIIFFSNHVCVPSSTCVACRLLMSTTLYSIIAQMSKLKLNNYCKSNIEIIFHKCYGKRKMYNDIVSVLHFK